MKLKMIPPGTGTPDYGTRIDGMIFQQLAGTAYARGWTYPVSGHSTYFHRWNDQIRALDARWHTLPLVTQDAWVAYVASGVYNDDCDPDYPITPYTDPYEQAQRLYRVQNTARLQQGLTITEVLATPTDLSMVVRADIFRQHLAMPNGSNVMNNMQWTVVGSGIIPAGTFSAFLYAKASTTRPSPNPAPSTMDFIGTISWNNNVTTDITDLLVAWNQCFEGCYLLVHSQIGEYGLAPIISGTSLVRNIAL